MKGDNHWQLICWNVGSTIRALKSSSTAVWVFITALAIPIAGIIVARHFVFYLRPLLDHHPEIVNSYRLTIMAACASTTCLISVGTLSRMILVKANVYSSSESSVFSKREVTGFVHQNRDSTSLIEFSQYVKDALQVQHVDSLSKAVALRHWVRCQQSEERAAWVTQRTIDHEDPHMLLQELRAGVPGACRRFSYILLGALLSAGLDARFVVFANKLQRNRALFHAVVEVWIEELAQWVLLDPTYDCIVLINGKAASAIELLLSVESGNLSSIAFDRNGSVLKPCPKSDFLDKCCHHLFLALSNAIFDGYGVRIVGPRRINFLHYNPGGIQYPSGLKQFLLGVIVACAALSVVLWTLSLVIWVLE